MRFVVGGGLVALGGLVLFGAVTGRLPAMIAAMVKPSDLIDSNTRYIRDHGGAIAGSPGSTIPEVPFNPLQPNAPAPGTLY